jgi:hypothetical protein
MNHLRIVAYKVTIVNEIVMKTAAGDGFPWGNHALKAPDE